MASARPSCALLLALDSHDELALLGMLLLTEVGSWENTDAQQFFAYVESDVSPMCLPSQQERPS